MRKAPFFVQAYFDSGRRNIVCILLSLQYFPYLFDIVWLNWTTDIKCEHSLRVKDKAPGTEAESFVITFEILLEGIPVVLHDAVRRSLSS